MTCVELESRLFELNSQFQLTNDQLKENQRLLTKMKVRQKELHRVVVPLQQALLKQRVQIK